jgi:hypothetical protein
MEIECTRRSAAMWWAFVVGAWFVLSWLDFGRAAAQECPFGYPVDCGTYCCESGGVCYNGGCNAPQAPDPEPGGGTCPAGYPVDCGSYCCESGGVCYNGGCNAPQGPDPAPGGGTCPAGYPVDCSTYCCESGGVCYDGGCNGPTGPDPEPGGGTCPAGYPVDCGTYCCESGGVCYDGGCSGPEGPGAATCPDSYPTDCGTFCCPSGAACGSNDTCLAGSSNDPSVVVEECPPSYPVDCGNDYCCPSSTTCTVDGCLGAAGDPISGSEVICASQAVGTDFGVCNLDFCIADAGSGSCESYYIVNGARISCSGCATDQVCVQIAAEACTGEGMSVGPGRAPSGPSPASGACCEAYDACDWANDGVCDCDGAYSDSWDVDDCKDEGTPELCSVNNAGAERGWAGLALALTALGLILVRRTRRTRT